MCGLVGIAGDLEYKDREVFKQLLIADTFRGVHSTGIAALPANKEFAPDILKATVPGWDFVDFKAFDSITSVASHAWFGHNRHATRGEINKANAHPFFVEDDLIGMHNGTLQHASRQFLTDMNEFGTDSEAALTSFVTRGTKKTLENIVGAWAFVWYDYRDNSLNFTRNDQRPLSIAVSKDSKKIWWASEAGMLKWVLGRKNIKDFKVYNLEPLHVVSYTMPETVRGEFKKPRVFEYEEKKPFFGGGVGQRAVARPQGNAVTGHHGTPHQTASDQNFISLSEYKTLAGIKNVLFPEGWDSDKLDDWVFFDGYGNALATPEEQERFASNKECSLCGSPIDPTGERWRAFPNDVFVCESCAESPDVDQTLFHSGVTAA